MTIFLFGPDAYRRKQKLKEIVSKYQSRHFGASDFFSFNEDGGQEEFLRLKEFVRCPSIFEESKLAVLENIFEEEFCRQNETEIISFLKSHLENKNLVLVIVEEKKPPKKFDFLSKKSNLTQEFKNLEGQPLIHFIRTEAEKRSLALSSQAINFLAEVFKSDTWGIITELEKLSLFNKKNLDLKELKELVVYRQPLDFFKFFKLISSLSADLPLGEKLVNLENLFLHQEEPAKIFNFLAASKRYSLKMIKKIADYDAAIKSGKLDYEEALLDLI